MYTWIAYVNMLHVYSWRTLPWMKFDSNKLITLFIHPCNIQCAKKINVFLLLWQYIIKIVWNVHKFTWGTLTSRNFRGRGWKASSIFGHINLRVSGWWRGKEANIPKPQLGTATCTERQVAWRSLGRSTKSTRPTSPQRVTAGGAASSSGRS